MPAVKILAFLEIEQNWTFFKRIIQNIVKGKKRPYGII